MTKYRTKRVALVRRGAEINAALPAPEPVKLAHPYIKLPPINASERERLTQGLTVFAQVCAGLGVKLSEMAGRFNQVMADTVQRHQAALYSFNNAADLKGVHVTPPGINPIHLRELVRVTGGGLGFIPVHLNTGPTARDAWQVYLKLSPAEQAEFRRMLSDGGPAGKISGHSGITF